MEDAAGARRDPHCRAPAFPQFFRFFAAGVRTAARSVSKRAKKRLAHVRNLVDLETIETH